jgi:hypothetical protein
VETIVCYHGGVVDDDANGQLRRVLRETPSEGHELEQHLIFFAISGFTSSLRSGRGLIC